MPYTRGLLREAMRLYPVAPFLTRLMPNTTLKVQQHGVGHLKYFDLILSMYRSSPFQLGPYSVPPCSLVLLSSYTMAMDSTIFYKPDLVLPGPISSDLMLMSKIESAQRDGSVDQTLSLEPDRRLPLFPSVTGLEAA